MQRREREREERKTLWTNVIEKKTNENKRSNVLMNGIMHHYSENTLQRH